jgi:hypothetical protein
MEREEVPPERLIRFHEMMKIRARIVGAGEAIARGIKFLFRKLIHRSSHLKIPKTRECYSSLSILIGKNAIEHVNSAVNRFKDIDRCSDSHEVARKIVWKHLCCDGSEVFSLGFCFTDSKSSDRESIEALTIDSEIYQNVCTLLSKILVTGTLNNAEHTLSTVAAGLEASLRPPVGELHGGLRLFVIGITFNTLIKNHHDVAIN